MTTHTVLYIIKMLDNRINQLESELDWPEHEIDHFWFRLEGKKLGLEEFRDHLQSYIEGQLNAEEIRTGEQ